MSELGFQKTRIVLLMIIKKQKNKKQPFNFILSLFLSVWASSDLLVNIFKNPAFHSCISRNSLH